MKYYRVRWVDDDGMHYSDPLMRWTDAELFRREVGGELIDYYPRARDDEKNGTQAITLPDGYNGHTVELDVSPVLDVIRAPDGRVSSVKLRATGSTYLIRWVYVGDYERLSGRKLEAKT